jgi:hypothetical protein
MKRLYLSVLVLLFFVSHAQQKSGLLFASPRDYRKVGPSVPFFYKGTVPISIDLSTGVPPVNDQGRQNSCVGWALGYTGRSYYNLKAKEILPAPLRPATDSSELISPAFIYNLLNNGQNKGISLYRALRLMMDTGACSIKMMPYDPYDWHKLPGEKEIDDAKHFRIDTFKRITISAPGLKAELMAHNPVVCAAVYDQRYFNYGYNNKQTYYLWDTISKVDPGSGGHAIVLVGYNDKMRAFKFVNSWGANWGNKGYGWISYKIIQKALREAYIIKPRLTLPKPHLPINIKPLPTPPPLPPANYFRQEEVFTAAQFKSVQQQLRKLVNDTLSGLMVENISIRQNKDFGADQIILRGYSGIRNFNCNKYKVVVRFFFKDSTGIGRPVISRNTSYQLANGQVAGECETNYVQYDNSDWDIWQVSIPVSAFKIPKGKQGGVFYEPRASRLMAEPVLFVDDFPLIIGTPFEFEVRY